MSETRKRSAEEWNALSSDQMHVKGKLKKYSRIEARYAQGDNAHGLLGAADDSDGSETESDEENQVALGHVSAGIGQTSHHNTHQRPGSPHNNMNLNVNHNNNINSQHLVVSGLDMSSAFVDPSSVHHLQGQISATGLSAGMHHGGSGHVDMDVGAPGNSARSLEQSRTEIAIRIERERLKMEMELQHEKARSDRRKNLDRAQIEKDQVMLQFFASQFEAAQLMIRSTQLLIAKLAEHSGIGLDELMESEPAKKD